MFENPTPMQKPKLSCKPSSKSDVIAGCAQFVEEGNEIELMVGSRKLAHRIAGISYAVCEKPLPPYSFHRINNGLYVASPEFMFVGLSKGMSLFETCILGCELIGTYVLRNDDERGFSQCAPLASKESLQKTIDKADGFLGVKQARKALPFLLENSASPMETRVALLLTLPCRLGGYGLPKPSLNHSLQLSHSQQLEMKRNEIRVDMAWPKSRLVIEYESTAWHSGNEKFIQDSKRRNDIRSLGFDVTTITLDEYKSQSSMDRIASDLAVKLGGRLRLERIDRAKQHELRRKLMYTT